MFNNIFKAMLMLTILNISPVALAGGEGGGGGGSSSGGGGKVVIGKNSLAISVNGGDMGGGGGPKAIALEGFGGDGCGGGGPVLARLVEESLNDFSKENSYLILNTSNDIHKIPTSDTLGIENALNDISHNNIIIKAFSIR